MGIKKKLLGLLAILAAVATAVLLILKEVFKGRVTVDHLENLKNGIKDEKKQNEEVIKENVEKVKLQDKIIKKKKEQIKGMSMDEQLEYAKKLGLVE